MYIVTVFPITRGAFKERLTYWSSHKVHPGSIISVPLRGRTIPALVETVNDASHAKNEIKNASFMTRKLEKTNEQIVVHASALKAAERTAYFYASPLGSVVKSIIPEIVLSEVGQLAVKKSVEAEEVSDKIVETDSIRDMDIKPEVLIFQSSDEDRYGSYKSIVREEFARKKSVLIVVPTTTQVELLGEILKKGIDNYVITLHGSMTKKQQKLRWDTALEQEHTVVIIATPTFISVPRSDISTIILDNESSRIYAPSYPPFIDFRTYIEYYAEEKGVRLILADNLLRIETLHRRDKGEIGDLFQPSFRIETLPKTIIVDLADPQRKEKESFKVLSDELVSMIEYAQKKKEQMFIFCTRRGLSPQTVCGDCGKTVTCDFCSAPVVLHNSKTESNRYFLCHHCGHKRSALEACRNCAGWKLQTLGIAIDTIHQAIEKKFPDITLFKIDRDTVKTDKQARELIKEYEKTPGAILIGTEIALTFLPVIPNIAIASMDSLFSLPDFRVNERVCHILLKLLACASTYLLIQTRSAQAPLLKQITGGTILDFYREELSVRQAINYPPFATHIKITIEERKDKAADEMEKLQQLLEAWNPMIFPAFIPTLRGHTVLHMLISLPPEDWPDEKLRNILVALPREFIVKVNPESLL